MSIFNVTHNLNAMEADEPQAASQLLPLVYDELRKLAAAKLALEKPGQTLDATALVHEAYIRLIPLAPCESPGANGPTFANRRHFFAAAAEAMRRILVESARRKNREKRGGDFHRVEFQENLLSAPERDERLIALDEALERFAAIEPEKAELLKLRSFAGMTLDEAALVLGISATTADRWWAYARAWLRVEISGEKSD